MPLAALEALQKFVDGQPITAAERGIVNRAVGLLGPPPYGATIVPASSPQAKPITPTVPTQPKYRTRAETIVAEAYGDILGRAPDAGGLSYWSGLLSSGQLTQDELRRHLASSAESRRILTGQ